MNDPLLVSVLDGRRNLDHQLCRFAGRQRTFGHFRCQARSLDVGHGEVVLSLVLADFENGHDAWMVELRRCFCLGMKPLDLLRAGQLSGKDQLQGHDPLEVHLAGLVDDAHPAARDLLQQLIIAEVAELGAGARRTHGGLIERGLIDSRKPGRGTERRSGLLEAVAVGKERGQVPGQVRVLRQQRLLIEGMAFLDRFQVVGDDLVDVLLMSRFVRVGRHGSFLRWEVVSQSAEPPLDQSGHSGRAASEVPGNLVQRPPLQVMQGQGLTLGFRQARQGIGELHGLLAANRPLTGGRLIGCQPRFEAGRRLLQIGFYRPFTAYITLLTPQVADCTGQLIGQDLPQPGGHFGVGLSAELVDAADRLQQGLLDNVRGVHLGLEPPIELEPGQEMQVGPVSLKCR